MTEDELLFERVDDLLKRARGIVKKEEGERVDPTTARSKAKEFAVREEKLVGLFTGHFSAETCDVDDSPTGYNIVKQNIEDGTTVTVVGLRGYQAGGIGAETIRLLYFNRKPLRNPDFILYFSETVGVDTLIYLCVGKHMDEQTRLGVETLLRGEQILPTSLDTIYVFDKNGNYGKVSVFPKSVLDQRPDLGNHPSLKHVLSEVTTADFRLVDKALLVLESRLK